MRARNNGDIESHEAYGHDIIGRVEFPVHGEQSRGQEVEQLAVGHLDLLGEGVVVVTGDIAEALVGGVQAWIYPAV